MTRIVPSHEEARVIWRDVLRYLVLAHKATPWVREAWRAEKREIERKKDREHSKRRRANMTVEARRQEWRKDQQKHRAKLEREALQKREESMR